MEKKDKSKKKMSFQKSIIKKLLNRTNSSKLPVGEVKKLCKDSIEYFDSLPNVIEIDFGTTKPIQVVGDLHGQELDLLHIFKAKGIPSNELKYVFLGDYIDGSPNSLRIILLIFAFSVELKKNFVAIRGNHEALSVANIYGFRDEVFDVYGNIEGNIIYTEIMNAVKYLPLACVIGKKYFTVHAGLSRNFNTVNELNAIERRYVDLIQDDKAFEIGGYLKISKEEKILVDVLWSDPNEKGNRGFVKSPRGVSELFGEDVTERFCKRNGFECIIRSHQLIMEGYRYVHNKRCLTIFSASNYCSRCGNKGAIVEIDLKGKLKPFDFYLNTNPVVRISSLRMTVMKNIHDQKKVDFESILKELKIEENSLDEQYRKTKLMIEEFRKKLIEGKVKVKK